MARLFLTRNAGCASTVGWNRCGQPTVRLGVAEVALGHVGITAFRMTIVELVKAFMDDSPVAVVVTDGNLELPGPAILYANAAFGQLTGRDHSEVVGQSPRFMQGRETRRTKLDAFHRALAAGNRFHGFLTNYRANGTKYRVEIDCRPVASSNGSVEHFIAFQREVVRRLGRPTQEVKGRYVPGSVSNDLLTDSLRAMDVFNVDESF